MASPLWEIAVKRAQEQSDSSSTASEIRWNQNPGRHRKGLPDMKPIPLRTQAAPVKPVRQFKAYTLQRRPGGGWVMVTVLAQDTDVVDESEIDSRQAQFTRIEDELRRLE